MNSPFIPRQPVGWPLFPVVDDSGSLNWPNVDLSVRQAIKCILMTRKGEWLLARDRGVGLADYLHQQNNSLTRRRLRDKIIAEVSRLERRIFLDDVVVASSGDRGNEVTVTLNYRVRRSGKSDSLNVSMKMGS